MKIRRLNWAGALIEHDNLRVLIDPIFDGFNLSFFGKPKQEFSPIDTDHVDAILITHLHSDHFDPKYIAEKFGYDVKLLIPYGTKTIVQEKGFQNVKEMMDNEEFELKDMKIVAVKSVDGLGDKQVSWILLVDEKKIIHCGDTLWHGYWWEFNSQYGPFDAALLPVNGVVVFEAGQINSDQPICMNPEQAVSASKILRAKTLIPIHYNAFHNPPQYNETKNVLERLVTAAQLQGINLKLLDQQEEIEI